MTNMLQTIIPKSDQTNFDDFIAGQTKTIKITNVDIAAKEQPVAIHYEGDNGKPYKPCKSMCRVLVNVWGGDAKTYIGRSLTLYGDPKVKFGGAEVGGIRISHMSHIIEPVTMALTSTRANRKPYTIQPLAEVEPPKLEDYINDLDTAATLEALKYKHDIAVRTFKDDDSRKKIVAAKEKRKAELTA